MKAAEPSHVMKEDGERRGEREGEAGGENKENSTYFYANHRDVF